MTHAAVHAHPHHHPDMSRGNITLAGPSPIGAGLAFVGLLLAALTIAAGAMALGGVSIKQALAAYHVGAMAVLAVCLGAMGLTMIFHLTNAGWSATIRRQFENVMSFTPWACLLVFVTLFAELLLGGRLFAWMNVAWTGDTLLQKKAGYFFFPLHPEHGRFTFPVFFFARAALYLFFWTCLARRLRALSVRQDHTGDPDLTLKARFTSSWGILVFALSTAFAGFDWLMSLDFRYFSTMWGVYFFAGAIYCGTAVVILIFALLRRSGKLDGVVTAEHFHDLGKLLLAFTVFWAYIAFSQYFLTWYSNLPEETAYFLYRQSRGWQSLGIFLMVGHFAFPFLILLFRPVKKNYGALAAMALLAIAAHFADIIWIIRPMAYLPVDAPGPGFAGVWLDILGMAAVPLILVGYLLRTVGAGPLVPLQDPRLPEALHHKNYV